MIGPSVLARVAFAGAIIGGSAVGLAAPAFAYPCDAMAASMTPHQSTACVDPADLAPAPQGVAPAPAEFVAPAEVATEPPVVGADVDVTNSFDASPASDAAPLNAEQTDPALNPDALLPQGDPAALEPNNGHH